MRMPPLFDFFGGLNLAGHKSPSNALPIAPAPIPPQLILPLLQHAGAEADPVVRVGDRVLRGQTIAQAHGDLSLPVHASSSGTVTAIEDRAVPHPSGLTAPCIVIDTDGLDEALAIPPWPATADWRTLAPERLRERVHAAGIAGLGGAAFPSHIKLNPGRPIDTLILNGAECEPYISCDHRLMIERAEAIIGGARMLLHALQAQHCLIGVEDDKTDAIAALSAAAQDHAGVDVIAVPTRYPAGGVKQLVQTLTGREVPSQGLPTDLGIVAFNVATAAAVWDAITRAQPLIERVVTVTGHGVARPRNYLARIGTPFGFLINQAGGGAGGGAGDGTHPEQTLIMGGPMMGFCVRGPEVPVVKATNCILVATDADLGPKQEPLPCIRCGECAQVCPARLLPQQLYWHARGREYERVEALHLFDCIECGCCAQVCPSHIPLVQYYRHAKTEIWAERRRTRKAALARERYEARQLRLAREQAEREAARARRKAQLATATPPAAPSAHAEPAAGTASNIDDPVARALATARGRQPSSGDAGPADPS